MVVQFGGCSLSFLDWNALCDWMVHFLTIICVSFLEKYGESLWKMRPNCQVCRCTCCLLYYNKPLLKQFHALLVNQHISYGLTLLSKKSFAVLKFLKFQVSWNLKLSWIFAHLARMFWKWLLMRNNMLQFSVLSTLSASCKIIVTVCVSQLQVLTTWILLTLTVL